MSKRYDQNEPEMMPLDWREYADRPDREGLPFWRYFAEQRQDAGEDDREKPQGGPPTVG